MDKHSQDYEKLCLLGGVIPRTRYANLFIEYIEKNNIAYKDDNGEYKKKTEILKIKQAWKKERAGEKKQDDKKAESKISAAFKDFKKDFNVNNQKISDFYNTKPETTDAATADIKDLLIKIYDELKKIDKKENPENPMDYDTLMDLCIKDYMARKKYYEDNKKQQQLKESITGSKSQSSETNVKFSNEYLAPIYAKQIYANRLNYMSLAVDLSESEQKAFESLTSPAAAAFTRGQISNTFGDAIQLANMVSNPQGALDMGMMMANLTAAAIARITTSVNRALSASLAKVMDISMFTNIPIDAAQQMLDGLMTAGEAIEKIKECVTFEPDKAAKEAQEKAVGALKNKVNDKLKEIQAKHGDGLKKFQDGLNKIVNTPNQSGDWYISNLTAFTNKMENAIVGEINAKTVEICDQKFAIADDMVDALALNLVAPVNEALMVAQKFILDNIAKAVSKAINTAKALAAKAIMKILGLLGV